MGGMLSAGLVGLFMGSVILALGYKLFQNWLHEGEPPVKEEAEVKGKPA